MAEPYAVYGSAPDGILHFYVPLTSAAPGPYYT